VLESLIYWPQKWQAVLTGIEKSTIKARVAKRKDTRPKDKIIQKRLEQHILNAICLELKEIY